MKDISVSEIDKELEQTKDSVEIITKAVTELGNQKIDLTAVYVDTTAYKGFKGLWQMKYNFESICTLDGTKILAHYAFNNIKGIQVLKLKKGNKISFNVTIGIKKKKLVLTRPTKITKEGIEE